jgi:hypothetical protein
LKLIGAPSVDHTSAAIELTMSCGAPGILKWRLTFKGASGAAASGIGVFGTGAMKITTASRPTLTVKPSNAARRALEQAHRDGHGLSVEAVLRLHPSSGAQPVRLKRKIVVRLG